MLPDVLVPGLKLVVCGSAAGVRSAAVGAYYAGRGNKFWRTLATTHLTPHQLQPAEYLRLPEFGIGLTDLVKSQAGSDSLIQFGGRDRAGLERRIRAHRPRYLCFNGKRAAQEFLGSRAVEYGLQSDPFETTLLFVAPSTSGAGAGSWDYSVWQALARLVTAAQHRR